MQYCTIHLFPQSVIYTKIFISQNSRSQIYYCFSKFIQHKQVISGDNNVNTLIKNSNKILEFCNNIK